MNKNNKISFYNLRDWNNNEKQPDIHISAILKQLFQLYEYCKDNSFIEKELYPIPSHLKITSKNFKEIYNSILINDRLDIYVAIENCEYDTFNFLGFCKLHYKLKNIFLEYLFIKNEYRRKHIGTNLLKYIESDITKRYDNFSLTISIDASNVIARKFLTSLNYYTDKIELRKYINYLKS